MSPLTADLEFPCTLAELLARLGKRLTIERRLAIVSLLAQQVQALHEEGRLHRAIDAEHVQFTQVSKLKLLAPPATCRLGGADADADQCPLELTLGESLDLPATIATATALLKQHSIAIEAIQIDLHQLGALLCRLLTNDSVEAYRYSPTTKAKVPALAVALLERALGHSERFAGCAQFIKGVDGIRRQLKPELKSPPAGDTSVVLFSETPSVLRAGGEPIERVLPHEPPPETIAGYRILGRLGRGGMGDVYKAYEAALERTVAIKMLPPELARHSEFVRRFRQEATAVAGLSHPNIVQVYAVGEAAGQHFFAMQYVEGESLADLLVRTRRLSVPQVLAIITPCLAGLGAAHAKQLIHRDIKPANILLDATGRPLIADFGLVKRGLSDESSHTATGVILGTMDYIAPEQARGQKVDARTDLYSLGVVMFQMLAGRLPFASDSATGMLFQHAYEKPPDLTELAPEVPPSLVAIVEKLLAKAPTDRFQSAREVLDALDAIDQPSLKRPRAAVAPIADAPDYLANLPADFGSTQERSGVWQRLVRVFHQYAPEQLRQYQNTTRQVDGAVAVYEERQRKLAQLLNEAQAIVGDFTAQLATTKDAHERAAITAQLVTYQQDVARLESEQSKAEATLASLRSQREILMARMKAAKAQTQLAGERGAPGLKTRHVLAFCVLAGTGLIFTAGLVLMVLRFSYSPPPQAVEADPIDVVEQPLVQLGQPNFPVTRLQGPHRTLAERAMLVSEASGTAQLAPSGNDLLVSQDDKLGLINIQTRERRDLSIAGEGGVYSPNGQQIVYFAEKSLHLCDASGQNARALTVGQSPTWSADGQRIYFYSAERQAVCSLAIEPPNSEVQTVFACADARATVSADGKWLAHAEQNDVRIVELTTNKLKYLWRAPSSAGELACSWSPDARELSIGSLTNASFGCWLFEPAGNVAYQLFETSVGPLAWSQQRNVIALGVRNGDKLECWTLRTNDRRSLVAQFGYLAEQPGQPLHDTTREPLLDNQPSWVQVVPFRVCSPVPLDGFSSNNLQLDGCFPIGEQLDLIIWRNRLLIQRERGTSEVFFKPENSALFSSVSFDGRYIWISAAPNIYVVDPLTRHSWKFTADDGLPIATQLEGYSDPLYRLRVVGVSPGKACAVGTLDHTWAAILTLDENSQKQAEIFYTARSPEVRDDVTAEFDTNAMFRPSFIYRLENPANPRECRVLVGRESTSSQAQHHPLIIDPQARTVEITNYVMPGNTSAGESFAYDQKAVYWLRNNYPNPPSLSRVAFPGDKVEALIENTPQGRLAVGDGQLFIIGHRYWQYDIAAKKLSELTTDVPWKYNPNISYPGEVPATPIPHRDAGVTLRGAGYSRHYGPLLFTVRNLVPSTYALKQWPAR
ncbi:MAG TPA: protein kinase [Pirellulaceae bacterium]|nr:protein kinase [Pirellulaceae bacterium]